MPRIARIAERLDCNAMPVTESGCLIWLRKWDRDGYGRIRLRHQSLYAHRIAWAHHYGPIPAGMFVLHRCDVPACINPDHLFLGTHADNMADRNRKGRYAKQHLNWRRANPHATRPRQNLPRPAGVI